jgi:hypothetical protein
MPRVLFLLSLVVIRTSTLAGQNLPPPSDTKHSMLRDAMLGLLSGGESVSNTQARRRCMALPVDLPEDRLQGPHGDSLLTTRCEVVGYKSLGPDSAGKWFAAQYRWTSLFVPEDRARGPTLPDTITENEVVIFTASQRGQVRPVWHARFEIGRDAVWRSITPELSRTARSTLLLSIMSCFNGTGGCGQEFMQRHADEHWAPVSQVWLDQLPRGFAGRIHHGVRIDPGTLLGEAGFYRARDPNCCPSSKLRVRLELHGDSLALRSYSVVPEPQS